MQNTNEESLLKEMREGRESANAAFVNFTDNYKNFTSHVFCFYEGEDGKYYNQRIKQNVGNDIVPIRVGGKKDTIKVWTRITSDRDYSNVSKMFFVDRDMDDSPSNINNDLYITPCYSIENLYVHPIVLCNILESEFSINCTHTDYNKCVETFNTLYCEFCEHMLEFNALVLLRKRKGLGNGRVSLSDIKTNQLLLITLDSVQKNDKYDALISQLKLQIDVEEHEVVEAMDEIRSKGNLGNLFRGKNQLAFFVKLITLLKQARKTDFFTTEHPKATIHVDSNALSSLSQYALTPDCLTSFISSHKIKNT